MLNLNKVSTYIKNKIQEAKNKNGTAIELFTICNIPVELLLPEEEKIINECLCSLDYITDFFQPGDFYLKNEGYLIVF